MEKMLFTSPQPEITITTLRDGKRDVRLLTNEEIVQVDTQTEETEEKRSEAYQYDGNQFRTVYPLTEEDILADKEKYLNYSAEDEPTLEQLRRENEIINAAIDSYTMELLEGGLL